MILKSIIYFEQPTHVICDARCEKAWGLNSRPREQLSTDEDDWEWLADDELGIAPVNPGTSEGGHLKPRSRAERLNKWCVRECERHVLAWDGENFTLPDFSVRRRNIG